MNITVTFDIAEPNFKIGDRVKLDEFYKKESKFFEKIESEYWGVPGTVVDVTATVTLTHQLQVQQAIPQQSSCLQQHALWEIHVLFDGAEKPDTYFQSNLIHCSGE